MNVNEVIAANVKRIREDRGLSRADLADRLGVGPHVVRDYERPRKGQPQREFTLTDLFTLCVVLETTLFELLLPPEGVTVDELASEPWLPETARRAGLNDLADDLETLERRGGRRDVGWVLFGMDGEKLDGAALEAVAEMGRTEQARREQIVSSVTKEMWERITEEMNK